MYVFWLLLESDPDSDFGPYGQVMSYLDAERAKDSRRFIYSHQEYTDPTSFNELDLIEIWLTTVDDAMLFKLAWPFPYVPLLNEKPKVKGITFK